MSDLENSILETIAEKSPFAFSEIRNAYENFKSFDMLIKAIDLSASYGYRRIIDLKHYVNAPLRSDVDYPTARMQQILEVGLRDILVKVLR